MRTLNRRELFQTTAAVGASIALAALSKSARAAEAMPQKSVIGVRMMDATDGALTIERRGDIVLLGLNRPAEGNRIDAAIRTSLSTAYFAFEHDASLRAAVLFGHGDHFCEGVDVQAVAADISKGTDRAESPGTIDPFLKAEPRLSKPVVVVAHGNTWNVGHELFLACDIRVASANTRFAHTENVHARMPASGATIRFVREAGWAQAMRYLLTGDGWSARDAQRMGTVQEIAPTAQAALQLALDIAKKMVTCAPLSIKSTLASAHLAIDESEAHAFSQLSAQRAALYATDDFKEALLAEKEKRVPQYTGR